MKTLFLFFFFIIKGKEKGIEKGGGEGMKGLEG